MIAAAAPNRAERRAIEKAARRVVKPGRPQVPTVNPLFSLSSQSRNVLGADERRAMDALLAHRATDDDCAQIMTVIESSIRAIRMTLELAAKGQAPNVNVEGMERAHLVFNRAGWAIHRARHRQRTTGVYGLDAADRIALTLVDSLVGEMRQPNVILRKTWMAALRESAMTQQGVELMPFDGCQL